MNYHKDTSYLLEPEQLQFPSKDHLNGFETAYGLQVNDEEKGEPVLMQRFRKRGPFRLETVAIQVEENGRKITYDAVAEKRAPRPAPPLDYPTRPRPKPAVSFPILPFWAERYRSEIQPLWRVESPERALQTPLHLYEKFAKFLIERDFLGAEATLVYLQSGTGRWLHSPPPAPPVGRKARKKTRQKNTAWPMPLSPEAEHLFERYWQQAQANPEYLRQRQALQFRL